MTDFVLVHGGWHGGWCWEAVADRLRADGHRVLAPTLSGLAERAHLIDLVDGPDFHVEDVVAVMDWNDVTDAVVVGHSYGGLVVTGVAGRVPDRIARLVYLDAFVPTRSGQSAIDFSPPERAAEIMAARRPDGHMNPSGFERWVSPERIEWLKARATAQPGGCLGKGVTLTGAEAQISRKDFIICARHRPSPFWQFHDRLRDDPDWIVHQIDCLHDAMVEKPDALCAILTD